MTNGVGDSRLKTEHRCQVKVSPKMSQETTTLKFTMKYSAKLSKIVTKFTKIIRKKFE